MQAMHVKKLGKEAFRKARNFLHDKNGEGLPGKNIGEKNK